MQANRKQIAGVRKITKATLIGAFLFSLCISIGAFAGELDANEKIQLTNINEFKILFAATNVSGIGVMRECTASIKERLYPAQGPSIGDVSIAISLFREGDDSLKGMIALDHGLFGSQRIRSSVFISVGFGNIFVAGNGNMAKGMTVIVIPSDVTWLLPATNSVTLLDSQTSEIWSFGVEDGEKVGDALRRCAADRLKPHPD